MTMGPERSKPLHNFTLPYGLKWGNQRHLRCAKVESNGEISSVHRRSNGSESIGRRMEMEIEMVNRRGSNDRFTRKFRSPGKEDDGDGIGAVREKLMFDLLTEADKMKETIFKEGMDEQPKKFPSPSPAPATTMTGAASDAAADLSRPWNLRTRRAACKEPNGFVAGAGAVAGGNGGGSKGGLKIDTNRTNAPSAGAASVGEKKQKVKFSVPLSRREIDEDFMAMAGHRPPRRPKKRPRLVQKNLDMIFPGLWLTEITADMYKVPDDQ
ncbi:uncharacterized protein [Solanum lycopersicum]|uniref:DUF1639 domain-containing protein n=1 Tax=Solanum lycopersicum TaxID=4081 RepID=A0A3Q7FXI8_SOLLC|nr:uncharacterized protein LOC101257950 [Solanum lycopersicum]